MSELIELDVTELGERIAARKVSPVEVAQVFLDRIAAVNERLNAFVTVTADQALAAAREAEKEIAAGRYRGPLHGVPVAHKDLYSTAGVRTTGGSRVLESYIPEQDATVVARLAEAGMVCLGKLNTHEFAYGPTGEHSMFGASRNPWDTSRISGGSSGGSGAAVGGRLVPIASGTDTGGSIRMPSAACGITGLKPTYGRVSRAGILPLCWTMDHPGPMAHSARDCALFMQAIAGKDPRDAATADRPVPDYVAALTGDIRGLKIGLPRRYFYDRAQERVVNLVEAALKELEKLGATLVDVELPHIDYAGAAAMAIYLAEATSYHEDALDDRAHLYTEPVRAILEMGDQLLAKDYLNAQRYRTLLGREMAAALSEVDVLATPGIPLTATPIGQEMVEIRGAQESVFSAILRNTEPFDLTGLPALVLPCGFADDGMPVSLQIAGRAFDEALVLNVGHAYQQATDWHRRSPKL